MKNKLLIQRKWESIHKLKRRTQKRRYYYERRLLINLRVKYPEGKV